MLKFHPEICTNVNLAIAEFALLEYALWQKVTADGKNN